MLLIEGVFIWKLLLRKHEPKKKGDTSLSNMMESKLQHAWLSDLTGKLLTTGDKLPCYLARRRSRRDV
jgi:hypothetical protein